MDLLCKRENYFLLNLQSKGDEKGRLISFEKEINCPFEIKRIFYIYDTKPSIKRGAHANRNSSFLLIPINGSCKVKIETGLKEEIIELNSPQKALYLDKMIWKEMYDFSYNAILLVLTDTYYDEKEYIRNYEDFIKEVKSDS